LITSKPKKSVNEFKKELTFTNQSKTKDSVISSKTNIAGLTRPSWLALKRFGLVTEISAAIVDEFLVVMTSEVVDVCV
jgi:hypothetical protein